MTRPHPLHVLAGLAGALFPLLASAQEVSVSGYGTLGYAQSNRPYAYQRFIDNGGTFARDSRLGVQLDARLAPAWSAAVQASLAPAVGSDDRWDVTLPWAFISWRPSNDLLLRAGKLRLPLLLYSENLEVGSTFNFARLPTEVYSLSPTSDMTGFSVGKNWLGERRDVDLEGYVGHVDSSWRFYSRDGTSGGRPRGPAFEDIAGWYSGLLLTVRQDDSRLRLGVHRGDVERKHGPIRVSYPFVPVGGGLGYYQVSDLQPGPGVPTENHILNYTFTAGAELALPHDFTLIGEAMRRKVTRVTIGTDSWAAYLALQKRIGPWTPYVYVARIRSSAAARELYAAINGNQWPSSLPGAAAINASQRAGADGLGVYDQSSVALGASYALAAGQKFKLEWLHSHSGLASDFIDAPRGEDSGRRTVEVFSLSYNFAF